jgi:flagellar protein FlbD
MVHAESWGSYSSPYFVRRPVMISVTRLNGTPMWINALLVEMVEESPDTYITLVTGKRLIVLEKADEVITKIRDYNRDIGTYAATIKIQSMEELT